MRRALPLSLFILAAALALLPAFAADAPVDRPYQPFVAPASNEAALAQKRIRVPERLRVDLFAAEPLLANPVAFCIDEHNRFYVAETFRLHAGTTDIRGHMDWLDDDLASRTVADRVALYRKNLKDKFASYEKEHDRIRFVEDRDGDGKADHATVFADGFHDAATGLGAGPQAGHWGGLTPGAAKSPRRRQRVPGTFSLARLILLASRPVSGDDGAIPAPILAPRSGHHSVEGTNSCTEFSPRSGHHFVEGTMRRLPK